MSRAHAGVASMLCALSFSLNVVLTLIAADIHVQALQTMLLHVMVLAACMCILIHVCARLFAICGVVWLVYFFCVTSSIIF